MTLSLTNRLDVCSAVRTRGRGMFSMLTLTVLFGAWSTYETRNPARTAMVSPVEMEEAAPEAPKAPVAPARRELIRSVRSFNSVQVAAAKSKRYDDIIAAAAKEHRIDPALIRAVIRCESNFAPRAVSRAGARGLMQLMPRTARQFGYRKLFDERQNIRAGTAYLSRLANRFGETKAEWIIAAYNAGEGAVERWGGIPPYPETQNYVRKVTEHWGKERKAAQVTAVADLI